ncbi:MAG: glycosyltransferase [Desulfovibrionales bacterium]|nr:MAG: glycosyltransferase [Desulfovibrionales bacterium]
MTALPAFCMPWHTSVSNAFQVILVDPLRHLVPIALTPWNQDAMVPLQATAQDPARPLIFCQLPPPELLLRETARVVWLPMWDNVARWPESYWAKLPKQLRIVAFSSPVEHIARRFGLPTLRVHFFLDPQIIEPVRHGAERTMIYWNRVGLYSYAAIRRICADLAVSRLIHIHRPDPGYDYPGLHLPERIDKTRVKTVRDFLPDADHHRLLRESSICLAPRALEGVGLTVLQSMARGACVLASDSPATNEYIEHGRSGYLFRSYSRGTHKWRKSLAKRWHYLTGRQELFHYHMISAGQIGSALSRINPDQLGEAAREEHVRGYFRWQGELEQLANFLTHW